MGIFNNKNVTVTKSPYLESFNMDTFAYKLLSDLHKDSFKISLEFNQTVYTGLKDEDLDIIHEGFVDFFKKAGEFFKKLALKIIEFAKDYTKYFISYFQDFNNFLKKNKEHLQKLDVDFTHSGYEYEFPNVPVLTKVYDIVSSYNTEITRVDTMTMAEVAKMREVFATDEYKNEIRASVLGSSKKEINQEDFNELSKASFIKSKDPIDIHINNDYINKIINEYGKMKELLDNTEKSKAKIVKMLHDLEAFFNRKAAVTYEKEEKVITTNRLDGNDNTLKKSDRVNTGYSSEKLTMLNTYFDYKYNESKFISNCVVTVYIDKVKAIKECMKEYKTIIRHALINKSNNDTVSDKKTNNEVK